MPDAVPKDVEVPPPGPAADQAGESEPKPRRRGIDARRLARVALALAVLAILLGGLAGGAFAARPRRAS